MAKYGVMSLSGVIDLCYALVLSNLGYRALDSRPGGAADDTAITLVWARLPRIFTKENGMHNAAHRRGWAFIIHRENGIKMLCVVVNQHIRTNAIAILTQYSRCIAQLISLFG